MDEHVSRLTTPLREVWKEFEQGEATLVDLARVAAQTASALDNAEAELVRLLLAADADLEHAQFALEDSEHAEVARRVFGPIVAELDKG